MAIMNPEMKVLQEKYEADKNVEVFQKNMKVRIIAGQNRHV